MSAHDVGSDCRKQRAGCGPLLAVAPFLLLALYVLADGPACWLWSHGYISAETLHTVYAPLNWVAVRSDRISQALEWYESLWMP